MLAALSLMAFLWLGWWALVAIRRIASGGSQTILFVFPIHFVLFGVPLLLDLVFGVPSYERFPGFHAAAHDTPTRFVYLLVVSAAPVIWWALRRRPSAHDGIKGDLLARLRRSSPWVRFGAWALLVLPVLLAALSPDPSVYFEYTPWQRGWTELVEPKAFHVFVSRSVQLSFVAAAVLLLRSRRVRWALVTVLPWLGLSVWLSGKRNAVAFASAFVMYAVWQRGLLRGRKLIVVTTAAAVSMAVFFAFYQTELRFPAEYSSGRTTAEWFEGARIDFGRDNVLRLAISAEVSDVVPPLLERRGQSVSDLLPSLARRGFDDERRSYPNRLTEVALATRTRGGGGVTTSIFDESIANFGLVGGFLAPLLIVAVSRIGDSCRDPMVSSLTLFVLVCLEMVHLPAWINIAFLWVGAVAASRMLRPRVSNRQMQVPVLPSATRSVVAEFADPGRG